MVSHTLTPSAKKHKSVAVLRSRIAPKILEHSGPEDQSPRLLSNNRGPTEMSMLQHLLCGCLGVSFIILFMGAINIMVNTLIDQTFTFSINELLWMFGH